jgi:DNA-binding CsgD family transcriptional regulator
LITPPAGRIGTISLQLVDRTHEQAALDSLLEAVRLGMSGKLVLWGEAGIGKTALLEHIVGTAHDFRVARAVGIESEMQLGFAGLHQLVVPFLPQLDQLPQPQQNALGSAFGLISGPPPERFQVGLATLTLLARAAGDKPLLCVIDDAHWLDVESAETLAFVARRLYADRVAMLFGMREGTGREAAFAGIPELRVPALDSKDAQLLLGSVIAGRVGDELSRRLINETAGNPLAILELGPTINQSGPGGGPLLEEPPAVGSRLQQHFLARVRALPVETQAFLQLASVDSSTDPVVLWHAARQLGLDRDAAAAAESERLIAVGPPVSFRHPLIRSAIYHGTPPGVRRTMHAALADAIDPKTDPDRHAEHRALAAVQPDEEIARELLRAAERGKEKGAYAAWARYANKAAELTPDRGTRALRLVDAAHALLSAGRADQARAALNEALPVLDDPLQRAIAKSLDGAIRLSLSEGGDTTRILMDAATALSPLDAGRARDALLGALTAAILVEAMPSVFEEIARLARLLPPADESSPSIDGLLLDGSASLITGDHVVAAPLLRRAFQELVRTAPDPQTMLRAFTCAGIGAYVLMDVDAIDLLTAAWIKFSRERGALSSLQAALAFRSGAELYAGRLNEGEALIKQALDLSHAMGNPGFLGGIWWEGTLLAWRGNEADARAWVTAQVALGADRIGARGLSLAKFSLIQLELGLGRYQAALDIAIAAGRADPTFNGARMLPYLIEAAVRVGDRGTAEAAVIRLAQIAGASGAPLAVGFLARSRALLANDASAESLYKEAIAHLTTPGTRTELARSYLLYGEWLRREGRRRDARDQLRTAYEMFTSMGMAAFAERARVELLATGERARRRTVETQSQLSPQESQIARLAAQGVRNQEIASQLFISDRTVEYHLAKVFRKVGVTSRTQLARMPEFAGAGLQ